MVVRVLVQRQPAGAFDCGRQLVQLEPYEVVINAGQPRAQFGDDPEGRCSCYVAFGESPDVAVLGHSNCIAWPAASSQSDCG